MRLSRSMVFVYVIVGLALIGLASQLFTNTLNFIQGILMMLGITVVVFLLFYHLFIKKRMNGGGGGKYQKAVKQSKQKYSPNQSKKIKQKKSTSTKVGRMKKRKRSRRASHLRVIEGNKNKKNDRAN